MVVHVQPGFEQLGALFVALIGTDVSPFVEQGAVEALDLAVGLGSIGAGEHLANAEDRGRFSEGVCVAVLTGNTPSAVDGRRALLSRDEDRQRPASLCCPVF